MCQRNHFTISWPADHTHSTAGRAFLSDITTHDNMKTRATADMVRRLLKKWHWSTLNDSGLVQSIFQAIFLHSASSTQTLWLGSVADECVRSIRPSLETFHPGWRGWGWKFSHSHVPRALEICSTRIRRIGTDCTLVHGSYYSFWNGKC